MNIDELKAITEEEFTDSPNGINTLEEAAEAQRRIQYFQGKISEVMSVVKTHFEKLDAQKDKIYGWAEKETEGFESRINFYTSHLQQYLLRQVEERLAQGKKPKKSIKLPYGSITLKSQQPEYEKDEELLLRYARENGFIKVKEEIDWKALKDSCSIIDGKLVDPNGEVVRGVVVKEREDKFEVKLKEVE